MSDLTDLVFKGKPVDQLEVVKSGEMKSSEVINSLTDSMKAKSQGLIDAMRSATSGISDAVTKGSGALSSMTGGIQETIAKGTSSINETRNKAQSAMDKVNSVRVRVGDVINSGLSSVNDIKESVMSPIRETMSTEDAMVTPILEIRNEIESTVREVKENPKAILGAMNKYLGDSEFSGVIDTAAEVAVLGTMVSEAVRVGVPEVIDEFKTGIKSDIVRQKVLVEAGVAAVNVGDFTTLGKVMDDVGNESILGRITDAPATLLSKYEHAIGYTPSKRGEVLQNMESTLDALDKSWYQIKVGGEKVLNTSVFSNLSKDSKSVLKESEKFRAPVMLSELAFDTDMNKLGKKQYPGSVFNSL